MTDFSPPGGPPAGDVPSYGGPPETGYPPAQPYGQYPVGPMYPQPGYGYPPGYPGAAAYPGAGYPNYPAPGAYPGYPGYAGDPRNARPGATMAAAVLGYINAGLLILAGGLLLLGSSLVADVESATDSHTSYAAEVFVDGIVNLVAAGLLIAGGVMISGRKQQGRVLLTVGNVLVLGAAVYWLVRWLPLTSATGLIFYSLLYAGMAAVSVVLSWLTPVTAWLTPRA